MPKFFVSPSSIGEATIEITNDDAKHIATVLRGKVGDSLTLCDGNGMDYECTISEISKKSVIAKIEEKHKNQNEPEIKITLFQSLPKLDKMELVIQKCIEIGVDRIVPVISEHTVIKVGDKAEKKLDRFRKIAEAAAKQCGRGKIPEVCDITDFKTAVNMAKELDNAIIPYEKEKERNLKSFIKEFKGNSIGIFIGPEGGFSEDEIKLCSDNGIKSITLGKRILRTETAGLVASVILLYELEDLS